MPSQKRRDVFPATKVPKLRRTQRSYNLATTNDVRRIVAKSKESKYVIAQFAGSPAYDSPAFSLLNTVAQGTTDTDRVGDEITMTGMTLHGSISAVSSSTPVQVRVLVLQWKHNTIPTLNDIFETGGTPTGSTVEEVYNHDNNPRLQVLYDRRFQIGQTNGTDGLKRIELFNFDMNFFKRKFVKKKVQYISNSSVASLNRLYVVCFSAANAAGGQSPNINWNAALRFRDG